MPTCRKSSNTTWAKTSCSTTCRRSSAAIRPQCQHVLANLDQLVVKPTNESGGYGIVLGPRASKAELEKCRGLIQANPRNYIAQPMLSLSRVPTIVDDHLEGRHVDLRPYILYGDDIYVLPGGLTARGPGQRLDGGQFVARGRQQGHLGDQERALTAEYEDALRRRQTAVSRSLGEQTDDSLCSRREVGWQC